MHFSTISIGVIASTLVSSAIASPVQDLAALDGRMVLGPGFMVPIDKTEDEYDVNASWMVPVVTYVNQDTNETIFNGAGYDIATREIESDLEKRAGEMRFYLGRKHVDVGCGATVDSVRNMFGAAVIVDNCFTEEILSIVAGGIHAALGVGFGLVNAMCAAGK